MGPQPNFGYYGEQKKRFNWKVPAIVLGGVILVLIAIFAISSFTSQNSIGTQAAHLSVRLTNLDTLTTGAAKQLQNGDLQKINAETSLITAGVAPGLASILPKKADKSVVAAESDSAQTAALANAALAGTYDAEYKTILTQKLESITALLNEMYTKTNSRSARAALKADYANYAAILADLGKVSV